MDKLSGKVALVTGGARGIGRGIVEAFVAEGARVLFTDIDSAAGGHTAAKTGAVFMSQDVAEAASWNQLMPAVAVKPGHLDILANNAGVISNQSIEEVARLAVFLASDDASFCTGGHFKADGGITAAHPAM